MRDKRDQVPPPLLLSGKLFPVRRVAPRLANPHPAHAQKPNGTPARTPPKTLPKTPPGWLLFLAILAILAFFWNFLKTSAGPATQLPATQIPASQAVNAPLVTLTGPPAKEWSTLKTTDPRMLSSKRSRASDSGTVYILDPDCCTGLDQR